MADVAGSWLAKRVGPVSDAAGLGKITHLSENYIRAGVASGDILVVRTLDGKDLYPTFQFDRDGHPLEAMADVIRLLGPIMDDSWDVALWLNTPTRRFDGRTAAKELRAGNVAEVLRWAERDGKILGH